MSREEDGANRRTVLKNVGAAAAIGAGLPHMSTTTVAGGGQSNTMFKISNKNSVTDKFLNLIEDSEHYDKLEGYFSDEYGGHVDEPSATAIRVADEEANGVLGTVLNLPIDGVSNGYSAGIAVTIENGSITNVSGSFQHMAGSTPEVEIFRVDGGEIMKTKQGSDYRAADVGDVRPADPWLPDKCDICKSLYDAVRTVGCGVTAAALCAAAGLATAGAMIGVCTAMVPAMCSLYNDFQDGHDFSPQEVCDGTAGDVIDEPVDLSPCA